jgi:hypothetical protein
MMQVLKLGSQGKDVSAWQAFLTGQGLVLVVDGVFGPRTDARTRAFQKRSGLLDDGVVGNRTYAAAARRGFPLTLDETPATSFPPRPVGLEQLSRQEQEQLFGKFRFKAAPTEDNPEAIHILDDWTRKNLVNVKSQAAGRSFLVHKRIAPQFIALLETWKRDGLLNRVLTWNGTHVARYTRGSTTVLSSHAWGTAFDINKKHNARGTVPALVGEPGCVRELVPSANAHGFYWGGHYNKTLDGMHFWAVKIL